MRVPLQTPHMRDMTATTVDVVSTSSSTANASPVVLHQTDMLRFKFIPSLVKNEKEPQKSVSGKLLYEKKRKKDDVFPTDSGDVSSKSHAVLLKLATGWNFSWTLVKPMNYTMG